MKFVALPLALFLVGGCPASSPRSGAPAPVAAAADEARFREAARLRSTGLADLEEGEYERAAEAFGALEGVLPDNVLPPIDRALALLRLDRLDEAHAAALRARALAPDNPQVLFALARILERLPGKEGEWAELLAHFARARPADPRPLYLEAEALARDGRSAEAVPKLREALHRTPDNLVLMVELLAAAADAQDGTAIGDALNALEDRMDGFDGQVATFAAEVRAGLARGEVEGIRPRAWVLRNLLRPTELYQIGLVPLVGGNQPGSDLFPQLDFDPPLPASIQGGQDIAISFVAEPAIPGVFPSVISWRLSGRESLLAQGGGGLLTVGKELGGAKTLLGPKRLGAGATLLLATDLDGDGRTDLLATEGGALVVLRGADGESLGPAERIAERAGAEWAEAVDVDHDADLDLLLGPDVRYLRNDGGGPWTDHTAELTLPPRAAAVVTADFDQDGDLDLVFATEGGLATRLNRRAGAFEDATATWGSGAGGLTGLTGLAMADFDLDGRFDLLGWGDRGGAIFRNTGKSWERKSLPIEVQRVAAVGDFDNDGDPDVVALGGDGHLFLLRNRRAEGFTAEAPVTMPIGPSALFVGDFDDDGDLDLVTRIPSGALTVLRNDGGNENHWLRLSLLGKTEGSTKNNAMGLFARVEARIGDAFQVVPGNGGVNHLGLGEKREADVVRVVWPNGLAQTWQRMAADQTLVEEQVLKGSCPFLYTWNGREFVFVTDLLWRSPLGMVLSNGAAAPHQSAQDFVKIPGDALRPAGGELWLQVTEELWEAAYLDRQQLIAVDHPAEAELVVDEKFNFPYPEHPPLHWLTRRARLIDAVDQTGRDVRSLVTERDGRYLSDFRLGRYQGTAEPHFLELTFDGVPAGGPVELMLWGWIFPTDTSINVALAQDPSLDPAPPRLELKQEGGTWKTLVPFLGFPNGKRKALVTDLTGQLPAGRVTLRVAGELQVYWDAAVLALGRPGFAPRMTTLEPQTADLHERGYSRLYRETPDGPHLFDYRDVETGPRFRDLAGFYTRFGEVTELLTGTDNRSVVMNAGDELTLRYDATALPPLPSGWVRDWVLATDGWVKDGDINTTASQTVDPLPYHGMQSYPDAPEHRLPDDAEFRRYLQEYQTRWADGAAFDRPKKELRP